MVRALRIASEVAVLALIGLPAFWLPPAIALPFGLVGFVAMCTHMAFRLHDANQASKDASSLNLHN